MRETIKARLEFHFDPMGMVKYFALTALLLLVSSFFVAVSMEVKLIFFAIVATYYLYYVGKMGIPTRIIIDFSKNQFSVDSIKFLVFKEKKILPLDQLVCTYDKEMHGKGIIVKILKIWDRHGNLVLESNGLFNGWNRKKMEAIYLNIQEVNQGAKEVGQELDKE